MIVGALMLVAILEIFVLFQKVCRNGVLQTKYKVTQRTFDLKDAECSDCILENDGTSGVIIGPIESVDRSLLLARNTVYVNVTPTLHK